MAGPYDAAGNTSASALLKARIREEEIEDIIAVVGQTFLGMTVNCARCHDHKFDPIPQRDYYQIKAALEGVRHGERALLSAREAKARETLIAQWNEGIRKLEKEIAAIENVGRELAAEALGARGSTRQGQSPPGSPLRKTRRASAPSLSGDLRLTPTMPLVRCTARWRVARPSNTAAFASMARTRSYALRR